MVSCLIARIAGFAALLAAAATLYAAPVAPFQAEYEVLRDGKELGQATLALRETGNGAWEFREQTLGTKGMASLLGLDVTETSTFRWRDDRPEGLRYEYAQKAAIKSRQRSTEFDWDAHEAHSRDGKRSWTAPLERSAMDRSMNAVREDMQPGQSKWFVTTMGMPGQEMVIGAAREQWFDEGKIVSLDP